MPDWIFERPLAYSRDREDIADLYLRLRDIQEAEWKQVNRLYWRAAKHHVSDKLLHELDEERHQLYSMQPEYLLNPFCNFKFAFRTKRRGGYMKRNDWEGW